MKATSKVRATQSPWAKRKPYPPELSSRGGCKVAWNLYATRAEAEQCSVAAIHNAGIAEREGFDFGYCAPGSIAEKENGTFEVCLP